MNFINISEKIKPVICAILIILLVVSRMVFPNDYSLMNKGDSGKIPVSTIIKSDLSHISHEALAKENTISGQANEIIRTNIKKGNNYEKSIVRICVLSLLISIFALFASLKSLYFTRYLELARQRLSIIIYIHNLDGRKRHILS